MKNDLTNASRLVAGLIVAAVVISVVAAWVTGNPAILASALVLVPGLIFALSKRKSDSGSA